MRQLRSRPPKSLGDQTVIQTIDYEQKVGSLPRADVLQWVLEDGSTLIIRPSGTEPKLKAYLSTYRPPDRSSGKKIDALIADCHKSLDKLTKVLEKYLSRVLASP